MLYDDDLELRQQTKELQQEHFELLVLPAVKSSPFCGPFAPSCSSRLCVHIWERKAKRTHNTDPQVNKECLPNDQIMNQPYHFHPLLLPHPLPLPYPFTSPDNCEASIADIVARLGTRLNKISLVNLKETTEKEGERKHMFNIEHDCT